MANKIGYSWHISNNVNRWNNMVDVVDGYTITQHLNYKTFCEWRIVLPNRNRFDPASQIQLAPQMRELPPKKDHINLIHIICNIPFGRFIKLYLMKLTVW